MIWNPWTERWKAALRACERHGGEARELCIQPPAAEAEVRGVETELGIRLPASFREVLTGFGCAVELRWFLPEEPGFPQQFQEIFSGECSWDLNRLVAMEERRQEWVADVFPNPEDPYDRVWHHKLAFLDVQNGDCLALDLSQPEAPVVYLSHDGGDGHGYLLGRDFADFIDRWSTLGCPGAEDWQMLPFTSGPASYLEPSGANAVEWRRQFGLPSS